MAQNFTLMFDLGLASSRLWAALKSFHLVFPNIAPETGDTMEVIEGKPGEPGAIMKINLGETKGGPVGVYAKQRVANVDDENLIITNEEIEGGHLSLGFKKWQTTLNLMPLEEKKVRVAVFVEYECDPTCPVCDMVLEQNRETIPMTFKALEVYLLSSGAFL